MSQFKATGELAKKDSVEIIVDDIAEVFTRDLDILSKDVIDLIRSRRLSGAGPNSLATESGALKRSLMHTIDTAPMWGEASIFVQPGTIEHFYGSILEDQKGWWSAGVGDAESFILTETRRMLDRAVKQIDG